MNLGSTSVAAPHAAASKCGRSTIRVGDTAEPESRSIVVTGEFEELIVRVLARSRTRRQRVR
jgi:hypothetical protein